MKLFIYLSLILFFISTTSGQSSNNTKDTIPETESGILNALKEIPNISFKSSREKEEFFLLLKKKSYKIGYNKGVLRSGDYLMQHYVVQGMHKKVVEIGNEMKKLPKNDENISLFANIYACNANSLGFLGLHEASLKDLKIAISYAERIKDKSLRLYYIALCYENITGYYHNKVYINQEAENKEYKDSILYYLEKSLETIKKIEDNKGGLVSNDFKYDHIAFVDMRLGIFYLEQSELEKAEKHLLESYNIHQNKTYNIPGYYKVILLNQLSWLYLEKKNYRKSIEYAESALELEKQYKNPHHRVESFEFLASSYAQTEEKQKAAFYLREFSSLKDSIRFAERNNADITMNTIVEEINQGYEKSVLQLSVYFTIAIIVVAIALYLFWRRRNKVLHKKYEAIISKIKSKAENRENDEETDEEIEDIEIKSTTTIPDETVKTLLRKLEKFEKSKLYLQQDVSVVWLSNHINTNTKYLSDIIKTHRDKSFTNYINGLKINYILNKLVNDPLYRQYKITYLSEECGYASRQVFLSAFKKETGFTPSYFIENLKKDASRG